MIKKCQAEVDDFMGPKQDAGAVTGGDGIPERPRWRESPLSAASQAIVRAMSRECRPLSAVEESR